MNSPADPADIATVSALNDPVRRRLYEYVGSRAEGVGREEAAGALDLAAHSVRFHLDRLVEAGLLEVGYRRLSGRTGPGAGRPAKTYRRAARDVAVSVPPRSYDLVGRVLAAAVQRSLSGAALEDSLAEEARAAGERDGATYVEERARDAGPGEGDELDRIGAALREGGYEPERADDGLVLHNCPFDSLAREHTELVCGVNHDYVAGLIDGLGCQRSCACLDPAPDRCCVRITPAS